MLDGLKPGDVVWLASNFEAREPRAMGVVTRRTATQILIKQDGVLREDRYRADRGTMISSYHGTNHCVVGIPTSEELHADAARKADEKRAREDEAAQRKAHDEKRDELRALFPEGLAEGFSADADGWEVRLRGLTEEQVRNLAAFAHKLK